MSSYKPIDGSKEDFRKYLDRTGVLDAMTKVLIKCNSDRPANAIDYILENMGDHTEKAETLVSLKAQLSSAQEEIERLKAEVKKLQCGDTQDDADKDATPTKDTEPASPSTEEKPIAENKETPVETVDAVTGTVPTTPTEQDKKSESKSVEVTANEAPTTGTESPDGKELEEKK